MSFGLFGQALSALHNGAEATPLHLLLDPLFGSPDGQGGYQGGLFGPQPSQDAAPAAPQFSTPQPIAPFDPSQPDNAQAWTPAGMAPPPTAPRVPQPAQSGPQPGHVNPWRVASDIIFGQMAPGKALDYEQYDRPYQIAQRQAVSHAFSMLPPQLQAAVALNGAEAGKAISSNFGRADLPLNSTAFNPVTGETYRGNTDAAPGHIVRGPNGEAINAAPGVLAPEDATTDPLTGGPIYRAPPKLQAVTKNADQSVGLIGGGTTAGAPLSAPSGIPQRAPAATPTPGGPGWMTPNVIKAIAGEAEGEGPAGMQRVASVILKRASQTGTTPDQVVTAPGQFEGLTSPRVASLQPGTPRYQNVVSAVSGAQPGQFDSFYSPKAQAALGRPAPGWDDGSGVDIGNHRFFSTGYAGPPGWKSPNSVSASAPPPAPPGDGQINWLAQAEKPRVLSDPAERAAAGIAPTDHAGYIQMPGKAPQKTGEDPFSSERVLAMRDRFFNSDEYKKYAESRSSYNAFQDALGKMSNNGVLDTGGVDAYLRSINPGASARNTTVQMFLEHLGMPQEVQSKVINSVGKGYLTPETLSNMGRVMHSFVTAHGQEVQRLTKADAAVAKYYGVSPDALGEDFGGLPEPFRPPSFGKGNATPPQTARSAPTYRAPSPQAVAYLGQHPETAPEFEATYGKGSATRYFVGGN